MAPTDLTFQELQEITDNFSEERKLGQGIYGEVYRGVTRDGEQIAVKVVRAVEPELDDKVVHDEFHKLTMLKHPNIVRFLSYCYEAQHVPTEYNGRFLVEKTSIALCFEYVHNGSLQKYLSDELHGLDWQTRYRIIKGTCEGLKYIHERPEGAIIHLDLKPDNVLLDKNMVPKLADISLSKIFGDDSSILCGLLGYCPPEYVERKIMSKEFDVFSLGVLMIDIVTGPRGYSKAADMPPQEFIDVAERNWRKRLQATWSGTSLEVYCQQVKICIMIALNCVERDRLRRPNIVGITNKLNKTENFIDQMKVDPQKAVQSFHKLLAETVSEGPTFRMEDDIYVDQNTLELIVGGSEKPTNFTLPLLQFITKNFSDELKIGHGGCGVVYKGVLRNGIVAVKRLFNSHTIDDKMFHQEMTSMMMVTHKNTVRLLGYCSHIEEKATEMAGKIIMAQIRERLLCFEYISNGSLENHLTDELRGLEWHIRYQIIKGICEGLQHLHKEKHIIHMDLKPANILLDDRMVPKITDFGLSRSDEKSQTMSKDRLLSRGYCAPEYLHDGKMSAKSDIYSLGVIITELVTGSRERPSVTEVLRRWRHRWNKSGKIRPLWYQQVTKCLDLAIKCMHIAPTGRPFIWDIIRELDEVDSTDNHVCNHASESFDQISPLFEDMLGIEPLEMYLPFKLNKQISCFIQLTNDTDNCIAFSISTNSLRSYHICPNNDIVPPRSKFRVTITLQAQEKAPLQKHCMEEFIVQSTRVDGRVTTKDITNGMFDEELGKVVDKVNLAVILLNNESDSSAQKI